MEQEWVLYKDFVIMPVHYPDPAGTGQWKGKVKIMRKNGITPRTFAIQDTSFKTEGEAIRGSLEYGKKIIDGKVPSCIIRNI